MQPKWRPLKPAALPMQCSRLYTPALRQRRYGRIVLAVLAAEAAADENWGEWQWWAFIEAHRTLCRTETLLRVLESPLATALDLNAHRAALTLLALNMANYHIHGERPELRIWRAFSRARHSADYWLSDYGIWALERYSAVDFYLDLFFEALARWAAAQPSTPVQWALPGF